MRVKRATHRTLLIMVMRGIYAVDFGQVWFVAVWRCGGVMGLHGGRKEQRIMVYSRARLLKLKVASKVSLKCFDFYQARALVRVAPV